MGRATLESPKKAGRIKELRLAVLRVKVVDEADIRIAAEVIHGEEIAGEFKVYRGESYGVLMGDMLATNKTKIRNAIKAILSEYVRKNKLKATIT